MTGQGPECDGLCITARDLGLPYPGVAYPHPSCPEHAPEETVCGCGNPDRCLSPTHGQVTMAEALIVRHAQAAEEPPW